MKKSTLVTILAIATYFLILSPFWLPDSVIYVKKGSDSIYQPYIKELLFVSMTIMLIFSIGGVEAMWRKILSNLKDE
jgi:O-antigen/teichoic acid export membrane protein